MGSPASRRNLLVGLKLTVSAGLLTWLLARADLPALAARFRDMNVAWVAAALATYGSMLWVSAWRWRLLLKVQAVDVASLTLAESFLVATFFNNFLPSNIGGDVVRIADTVPLTGSKTLATTVVLLDRFIGLVALFVVAALGSVLAVRRGIPLPGVKYLWMALATAVAGLVPALKSQRVLSGLAKPLHRIGADRALDRLRRLGDALERFGRHPTSLVLAFGGALVVQLLLIGFYLCAARSLSIPLPLLMAAIIVPVSLAAQMVPISINGFGVREAVFAFFFTSLGLSLSSALTLSLGSAGLIMLFSLSGGALFLLRPRRGNPGDMSVRYNA